MIDRTWLGRLVIVLAVLGLGWSQLLAQEEEEKKEGPNEVWWQLPDDSVLTATVTPWPLKQGATVTIRAEASTDDGDQRFKGTVHYRIVTTQEDEDSKTPWLPMA